MCVAYLYLSTATVVPVSLMSLVFASSHSSSHDICFVSVWYLAGGQSILPGEHQPVLIEADFFL